MVYETNMKELTPMQLIKNESEIGPEIMHEFKIINNGPSQISLSELLVTWQKQIKINTKHRDYLYVVESPYTEGPIRCQLDSSLVNPLNLSVS